MTFSQHRCYILYHRPRASPETHSKVCCGISCNPHSSCCHIVDPCFKWIVKLFITSTVNKDEHCDLPLCSLTRNTSRPLSLLSCKSFLWVSPASLVLAQPFPREQLFSAKCGLLLRFCPCILLLHKAKVLWNKIYGSQCYPFHQRAPSSCQKVKQAASLSWRCRVSDTSGERVFSCGGEHSVCGGPKPLVNPETLTKAGLCSLDKWRSGNISVITQSEVQLLL